VDFLGEVAVAVKSGVSLKRFFSRLLVPTPKTQKNKKLVFRNKIR